MELSKSYFKMNNFFNLTLYKINEVVFVRNPSLYAFLHTSIYSLKVTSLGSSF